jgi:hypothetical protein
MEAGPAQRRHDGLIRVTAQGRGQSIAYDELCNYLIYINKIFFRYRINSAL